MAMKEYTAKVAIGYDGRTEMVDAKNKTTSVKVKMDTYSVGCNACGGVMPAANPEGYISCEVEIRSENEKMSDMLKSSSVFEITIRPVKE